MKRLLLQRVAYRDTYTIGRLSVDGTYFCDTLEDKFRGDDLSGGRKVAGQTCIPRGTYKGVVDYSPRFKRYLPHLLDVPFFSGIRIHSGNSSADTEGCILVGKNKVVGKVIDSKTTMEALMEVLGMHDFEIEVR